MFPKDVIENFQRATADGQPTVCFLIRSYHHCLYRAAPEIRLLIRLLHTRFNTISSRPRRPRHWA